MKLPGINAPGKVVPRSAAAERRSFDRMQEHQVAEMRRRWEAEEMIGEGRKVEWSPPVAVVRVPAAWSQQPPEVAAQVVEIGSLGLDYLVAVMRDRVFDLWDAVYIVSGTRYPAGTRLGDKTVAALLGRGVFVCSECKRWRETNKKAGMTVTTLVPSVRCMDCRRVAGNHSVGGYFRDAAGPRKLNKGYAPERNSLNQAVDDVMSELVDDPVWGYDEAVEMQTKALREIAKETGLIVKVGPELTKAMRKRWSDLNKSRREGGAKEVKAKKEVKKEARVKFGHDRGRECFCARCVEARG